MKNFIFCAVNVYMFRIYPSYNKKKLREKCPYAEFFWSIFSCILPEYGEILGITPYSVRMREKNGQEELQVRTLFMQW